MLLQIYEISSMPLTDLFEDNKVQYERDVKPSVRGILLENFKGGIYKTLAKSTSLNLVNISKASETCKDPVLYSEVV